MSLYLRLASYLILIAGVFAAGYRVGSEAWKARYEALQAADWQGRAQAQQARADALDAQIRGFKGVVQNNSRILNELNQQKSQALAERADYHDRFQRLLADASRAAADCRPVSQTPDRLPAAATVPEPSLGEIAGLLAEAAPLCHLNDLRANSLVEQLKPQL